MTKHPSSVLITGASSGIGEALAMVYAGKTKNLAINGRDANRLKMVEAACKHKKASINCRTVDVVDQNGMRQWIETIDDSAPLDLVIANAGISAGSGSSGETDRQAREIFSINFEGMLNTIHPAIDRMRQREKGQIAIMSSLAGFRGLPGAPAYSASKAAARTYGEALRGALQRHKINVSVVCPGFVHTRMTARNQFPMPLIMDAERAALIIYRGLQGNKPMIAFPMASHFLSWFMGILPNRLTDPIMNAMPNKYD